MTAALRRSCPSLGLRTLEQLIAPAPFTPGSRLVLIPSSTHARQEIFVGPLHLLDDSEAALGQVPDCRA